MSYAAAALIVCINLGANNIVKKSLKNFQEFKEECQSFHIIKMTFMMIMHTIQQKLILY